MARTPKGYASADQVFQTYKGDSKVEELKKPWPDKPNEAVKRVDLVAEAHRPADRILGLAWELWEFDKDEFLKKVYSVWSKTATDRIFSWTFGDMFDHMKKNPNWVPQPFDPKKWAAVQSWRPGMKVTGHGPRVTSVQKEAEPERWPRPASDVGWLARQGMAGPEGGLGCPPLASVWAGGRIPALIVARTAAIFLRRAQVLRVEARAGWRLYCLGDLDHGR